MQIEIHVDGDVVERTELLNGTCTITIEGTTADGAWAIAGVVSWNRGLVDYSGEGDLSATAGEGEVFASLSAAVVEPGSDDEDDIRLAVTYEIDGGSGRFSDASGVVKGHIGVAGDRFEGDWTFILTDST